MEKLLYSVAEVAEVLKVNKNFVYCLIKAGRLRAVKIGAIKVYYKDLINYIEDVAEVV